MERWELDRETKANAGLVFVFCFVLLTMTVKVKQHPESRKHHRYLVLSEKPYSCSLSWKSNSTGHWSGIIKRQNKNADAFSERVSSPLPKGSCLCPYDCVFVEILLVCTFICSYYYTSCESRSLF